MLQLPSILGWNSLHSLVTHFPILLFLLVPLLLVLAGLCRGARNHLLLAIALVTMLAGMAFLGVMYFSGGAFIRAARLDARLDSTLSHHCTLAEYTLEAFAVATALFMIALFVRRSLHLEDMRDLAPWIPIGFIVFYCFGVFWLLLTARHGVMLARELLPAAAH